MARRTNAQSQVMVSPNQYGTMSGARAVTFPVNQRQPFKGPQRQAPQVQKQQAPEVEAPEVDPLDEIEQLRGGLTERYYKMAEELKAVGEAAADQGIDLRSPDPLDREAQKISQEYRDKLSTWKNLGNALKRGAQSKEFLKKKQATGETAPLTRDYAEGTQTPTSWGFVGQMAPGDLPDEVQEFNERMQVWEERGQMDTAMQEYENVRQSLKAKRDMAAEQGNREQMLYFDHAIQSLAQPKRGTLEERKLALRQRKEDRQRAEFAYEKDQDRMSFPIEQVADLATNPSAYEVGPGGDFQSTKFQGYQVDKKGGILNRFVRGDDGDVKMEVQYKQDGKVKTEKKDFNPHNFLQSLVSFNDEFGEQQELNLYLRENEFLGKQGQLLVDRIADANQDITPMQDSEGNVRLTAGGGNTPLLAPKDIKLGDRTIKAGQPLDDLTEEEAAKVEKRLPDKTEPLTEEFQRTVRENQKKVYDEFEGYLRDEASKKKPSAWGNFFKRVRDYMGVPTNLPPGSREVLGLEDEEEGVRFRNKQFDVSGTPLSERGYTTINVEPKGNNKFTVKSGSGQPVKVKISETGQEDEALKNISASKLRKFFQENNILEQQQEFQTPAEQYEDYRRRIRGDQQPLQGNRIQNIDGGEYMRGSQTAPAEGEVQSPGEMQRNMQQNQQQNNQDKPDTSHLW